MKSKLACALLLAVPMMAAMRPKTTAKTEMVSGTIEMVNPAARLMVVEGPGGVPFDMVVTPKTRIESGNQHVKLQDLAGQTNRRVSVQFVPERGGDIARSIHVTG